MMIMSIFIRTIIPSVRELTAVIKAWGTGERGWNYVTILLIRNLRNNIKKDL